MPLGLLAILASDAQPRASERPGRPTGGLPLTVKPTRRPPASVPAPLPSLPAEADIVAPLTLELQVQVKGGLAEKPTTERQTLSRTRDRVHLRTTSGTEWLFVRNLVDRRRAHGYLIDHARKTVVRHEESELRSTQQIRGWLDVLTLGFDPAGLAELTATDATAVLAGITFVRHVPPPTPTSEQQDGSSVREVWWSQTELLPMRVVSSSGRETRIVSIEAIQSGVDAALIALPGDRFPSYLSVDLPDWLEQR